MFIIDTIDLQKMYSDVTVLNLPDLKIAQGESFGLVGNNGAGKTTFFNLLLDLIAATAGSVRSKDKDVRGSEHWKSYTGSYLDEQFLIDFLTPEEYFEFIAKLGNLTSAQYDQSMDLFVDFFNGEVIGVKKYIRDLSKGNQKKIGIAAALMSEPEILILDEPFPHLDPSSVSRLKNILSTIKNKGNTTILISSHDLNHVTEICDRIVLLEKGNILHDLDRDPNTLKVLETYFHVDH